MALFRKDQNRQYSMVLLIFLLFHIGSILELVLLSHYESFWQSLPLITLCLGLVSLFLRSWSLEIVKFFYLSTILAGVLGVFLHLKNNWEFEQEMYAGITAGELFISSFSGALPALAPGTLIPIGLLGFHLIQLKSKNKSK